MTTVIASLALFTSVLLLIVHYRNQVERRHGEIAQLRSALLDKLSAAHCRLISAQIHMEMARLELRRVPDSADKYNSLDSILPLIGRVKDGVGRLTVLRTRLEQINTAKLNRGSFLMLLQSCAHDFHILQDQAAEFETWSLETLTFIRSKQDASAVPPPPPQYPTETPLTTPQRALPACGSSPASHV